VKQQAHVACISIVLLKQEDF